MAIPQYDFLQAPYDDLFLIYNYDEQRYVANAEGLSTLTYVGITTDVESITKANAIFDLTSRAVYTYIERYIDASKYDLEFKYFMAHSKEMRQMFINIFVDTVWYNRRDGGFMMAYNTGANLNQGKRIDFTLDDAVSNVIRQYISNSSMGNRIIPYNLNYMEYFDTLLLLKEYLLTNNFITQEQFDNIEHLSQVPRSPLYNCFMNADGDKYVFEDLKTRNKIINSQRNLNNPSGTW